MCRRRAEAFPSPISEERQIGYEFLKVVSEIWKSEDWRLIGLKADIFHKRTAPASLSIGPAMTVVMRSGIVIVIIMF